MNFLIKKAPVYEFQPPDPYNDVIGGWENEAPWTKYQTKNRFLVLSKNRSLKKISRKLTNLHNYSPEKTLKILQSIYARIELLIPLISKDQADKIIKDIKESPLYQNSQKDSMDYFSIIIGYDSEKKIPHIKEHPKIFAKHFFNQHVFPLLSEKTE